MKILKLTCKNRKELISSCQALLNTCNELKNNLEEALYKLELDKEEYKFVLKARKLNKKATKIVERLCYVKKS